MPQRLVITCNGKPVASFEQGEALWRARAVRDAHFTAQLAAGVSPSTLDYQMEQQRYRTKVAPVKTETLETLAADDSDKAKD